MLKLKSNSSGFTIIEITIALALIGGGLVIAMVAINSRLKQENFYKGASRFSSVINDILNDVSTNNWPHVDGWECFLSSNGIDFRTNPQHQTGDGECLYVGKVIQFGDSGKVSEDDGQYIVHTIMAHKNALIPTYNFDKVSLIAGNHPLIALEKAPPMPGDPEFSSRRSKFFPNGIQVKQIYYYHNSDKVYLRGLAVVQQSAHGLKENDLLLQSGAGRVGIRVIRDPDLTVMGVGAKDRDQTRLTADEFAKSLKRPTVPPNPISEFDYNFNLPIYICLGDGRGNQVLGLLGDRFGALIVNLEFDEAEVQNKCS